MHIGSRVSHFSLFVAALASPILFLWGLVSQGQAILDLNLVRLGVIYLALAIGAAAATYLVFQRGRAVVRVAAGIALLTNLGSIAYAEAQWRPDMQRALAEVERRAIPEDQTGILIAAANHSPQALEEARALEASIREIMAGLGLADRIIVRPTYPISSEAQARHVGRDLRANLVLWKSSVQARERYDEVYHVTVLGAGTRGMAIDGVPLLLTGMLQDTFSVPTSRWQTDPIDPRLAENVIVPVVTGLAFIAEGQFLLAGAQFDSALEYADLQPSIRTRLHNYMGATLLLVGRADLASEPFERSLAVEPNASAWVGLGSVAVAHNQWEAATAAFGRAVALDPFDASGYTGLGYVYARKRDMHNAFLSYQQAIALEPTSSVPFVFMGLLYELRADIMAAQVAYQEAAVRAHADKGLHAAVVGRAEEIRRNPPTPVPTATPRPVPSPTPIPTSALYTIASGDTLQVIADKFGVSISELVEINDIDDPNELYIGQVLMIPVPEE